jgi:hypothetical protein
MSFGNNEWGCISTELFRDHLRRAFLDVVHDPRPYPQAQEIAQMSAADVKFRVIRLPDPLRTAIRATRDANEWTNAEFVGRAVEQELPKLLENLLTLGFDRLGGQTRAMRLPFADEYGSLDLLREASQTVGLPAIQLLALCFLAATKNAPATPEDSEVGNSKTKRGRYRKTSERPKRKRTQRMRRRASRNRGAEDLSGRQSIRD